MFRTRGSKKGKKGKNSWNEGFRKSPGATVNKIIQNRPLSSTVSKPHAGETRDFYTELYSDLDRPANLTEYYAVEDGSLFSGVEVASVIRTMHESAVGLDHITVGALKLLLNEKAHQKFKLFVEFLNVCLKYGVPGWLKVAKVSLLPKVETPASIDQYRPVSVTSVVYRVYSKLLLTRLNGELLPKICTSQAGYIPRVNGCSKNIAILQSVIGESSVKRKSICLLSVDIRKAFDSVKHEAIVNELRRLEISKYLIKAAADTLTQVKMFFDTAQGKVVVSPTRGVPQGAALSGALFVAAMNPIISAMNSRFPYKYESEGASGKIGCLGMIDDLIILSKTEGEMRAKMACGVSLLKDAGLELNVAKCFGFAWRKNPGVRERVLSKTALRIGNGTSIKLLRRNDTFRYLGMNFGTTVKLNQNRIENEKKLNLSLDRIRDSKLSVTNKVHAITKVVIPKFLYRLANLSVVGVWKRNSSGINLVRSYESMDERIMRTIKAILRVKKCGVTTDLLRMPRSRGGLGLELLAIKIPLMRLRVAECFKDPVMKKLVTNFALNDQETQKRLLEKAGFDLESSLSVREQVVEIVSRHMRTRTTVIQIPTNSVAIGFTPIIRNYNGKGAGFTSWKLQRVVKLVLNAMPTRSFLARGKDSNKKCRKCNLEDETLGHILASKCDTKEFWIMRHNRLVAKVAKWFEAKANCTVAVEFGFDGTRRPDIVIIERERVTVLEIAITFGGRGSEERMRTVSREKFNKYSSPTDCESFRRGANCITGVEYRREVKVVPLIFTGFGAFMQPNLTFQLLCGRMRLNAKLILELAAEDALSQTAKFVSTAVGGADRRTYGNTRIS